jgi:hypothetical protein
LWRTKTALFFYPVHGFEKCPFGPEGEERFFAFHILTQCFDP